MAEKLMNAGMNTLVGLTVVFAVLILISFIISLFKYISVFEKRLAERKRRKEEKKRNKNNKAKSESEESVEKTIEQIVIKEELANDDLELVAVITAAICAATGSSADSFVVRSVRKIRRKG